MNSMCDCYEREKADIDARVEFRIWYNRIEIPNHVWHPGWYYELEEKLPANYSHNHNKGPYRTRREATIACMRAKDRWEKQRIMEGYRGLDAPARPAGGG